MLIWYITAALNNLSSLTPANILHVSKCLISYKILFSLSFLFCELDQKVKFQEHKAALISHINLLCCIRRIEAHIYTSKYWNFIQENLNWNDFISHLEIKGRYLILLKAKQKHPKSFQYVLRSAEEKVIKKLTMNKLPINQKSKPVQAIVSTPYSHSQFSSYSWADPGLGFGSISSNATKEVMIFTFLPNCWWFSSKTFPPLPCITTSPWSLMTSWDTA